MEVTSLEQSKALLESGLKRESADLWWVQRYVAEWVGNDEEGKAFEHHVEPVTYLSFVNEGLHDTSNDKVVVTPAWSLGKLIDLVSKPNSECECSRFILTKGAYDDDNVYSTELWSAHYENQYWWSYGKSAIDALVDFVLKLVEKGIKI